jgi:sugar phosphate isomerase/epimerase
MKVSISELTTYPAGLDAELAAYSMAGFSAVELSLEKIGRHLAGRSPAGLRDRLAELGLIASGAVSFAPKGPSMLLSSGDALERYLGGLREELALCRELGIRVLGIGADAQRWASSNSWRLQAVRNLRAAAAMADDHDVRLAIEYLSLGPPIGPFLLETLVETRALLEEADHPGLGLTIDFFHHFRGGGTPAELASLDRAEIANIHVTDVKQRERAALTDDDRVLPGMGNAPVTAYRDALVATGYEGCWTLELLNPELWTRAVDEVALQSIDAKRSFSVIRP